MLKLIHNSVEYLKKTTDFEAEIGIILGTGLGGLVNEIKIEKSIAYKDIPNFPVSTVEGHQGKLIFGLLGNKKVIAMKGRFHFYEGYTMSQIVFPVRVMKFLGINKLIVSNASGGVNPNFEIGDIMIINDHINLFPTNPLIGPNIEELGTRFPDMSDAYDEKLISLAQSLSKNLNIKTVNGVYAGLSGPTLETPAEYSYIKKIGADAVGMSTVPEVIAARHMQIPCFGLSIITDLGVPGKIVKVTHQDVQNVASKAEQNLTRLIKKLLESI